MSAELELSCNVLGALTASNLKQNFEITFLDDVALHLYGSYRAHLVKLDFIVLSGEHLPHFWMFQWC